MLFNYIKWNTMKENIDKFDEFQSENNYKNLGLSYLFWIKILFGIIGGVIYYFIQRFLFSFPVSYLIRGLLIITIFLVYIIILQIIIIAVLNISKSKFKRLMHNNIQIWRYSLKFSFIYLVIFMLSASLIFYIGI